MTEKENITVPRWFLEVVEDTLRIQNNINLELEKGTGETCQDRNVKESLNGIRKLLKGEELTGMERLEKLQPSLSSGLDEAAEEFYKEIECYPPSLPLYNKHVRNAFKAGAKWMAVQFQKIEGDLVDWYSTSDGKDYCCGVKTIDAFEVPEGFYIRKKQ